MLYCIYGFFGGLNFILVKPINQAKVDTCLLYYCVSCNIAYQTTHLITLSCYRGGMDVVL